MALFITTLFCAYSSLYPFNTPLLPSCCSGRQAEVRHIFPFGQLERDTAACQMWHLWQLCLPSVGHCHWADLWRVLKDTLKVLGPSRRPVSLFFVVMSLKREKKIVWMLYVQKEKNILDIYSKMWLQVKAALLAMTWTLLRWAVPSVLWSWSLPPVSVTIHWPFSFYLCNTG